MKEIYHLNEDIKTFYVAATSFPDDAQGCHARLHALLPTTDGRVFYGISYSDGDGGIIYKAAVKENYSGEAEQYGCESFTILAGDYLAETVKDWPQKMNLIGPLFQELLKDPRLDPEGYCLEWYKTDTEMLCMVKLKGK